MAQKTSPPVSLHSWLEQVNQDSDTPSEFKNGAQYQLQLSSVPLSSGSELEPSESLRLRFIWSKYRKIEHLSHLMVDDAPTEYTGYISAENYDKATRIFNDKRPLWQSYFQELSIRKAEQQKPFGEGAVPSAPLGPPREGKTFMLVHYWQLLSMTRDIDEVPGPEELRRQSSISKPGNESRSESTAPGTPPSFNRPITPDESMPDHRMDQDTPMAGIHSTPQATSYYPAIGGALNQPATDESYVNTALLELLNAIKLDVGVDFGCLDWLAKRLPLKLMDKIDTWNPETAVIETHMKKLMEARLDGYLCRRFSPFEKKLNVEPLAILEAKPYTRSSALASIRRQEGAEMACWISQAGNSKTGLLRESTSGRKRRLMVSQDRHEIYLIVGEYGAGYEQYIRPSRSAVARATKSQKKPGKSGSSSTRSSTQVHSRSETSFSAADRRDPRLLAGSPSYIKRVETKNIKVVAGPRGREAQPTRSLASRKSPRTDDKEWIPDAGDFLIMHEFGPFITTDPTHMEVLIRRLIAFMLQLRGPQDFTTERPGPDFLGQTGNFGPTKPNKSSSPRPILKRSRSWPEDTIPAEKGWVRDTVKRKWRG